MELLITILLLIILLIYTNREIVKRNNFKTIQSMIDAFNKIFDSSNGCSFQEEIDLPEEIEVFIDDDEMHILQTSLQARDYLLYLGNHILSYEEELVDLYGEVEYNDSYHQFRKKLIHVRASYISNTPT